MGCSSANEEIRSKPEVKNQEIKLIIIHLDSNYSKKIFEKKFNKKNYLYLNKKKLFIINSSNGSK